MASRALRARASSAGPRGTDACRRRSGVAADLAGSDVPTTSTARRSGSVAIATKELQRGGIRPLQVLEEQHERRPGLDEAPSRERRRGAGTVLCLHRTDLDEGWRLADELLQLRDALREDAPIRRDCRSRAHAGPRPGLPAVQRLPDEPTDRVEKRGVGNVALEEIALALEPRQSAARSRTWRQERRFPDARGPATTSTTSRDRSRRARCFAGAPLPPSRVRTDCRRSGARTGRRGGRARSSRSCPSSASACAPLRGPPRARRRSGNALLGHLREELDDDVGQNGRHARVHDGGRVRAARDVRVQELQRVARGEGGAPVSIS